MSCSVRVFWGPFRGRHTFNFNWPGVINAKSVVHISVSEALFAFGGGNLEDMIRRFVGEATITLHSVSPHDIGVTFDVTIDSGDWHYLTTDISVLESLPEQYIWAR